MKKVTRRALVVGIGVAAFATRFFRSSADRQRKLIFVGTYTNTTSKGIYAFRWSPQLGEMTELGLAADTPDPSFLALSHNRKDLYCVNEEGSRPGSVSSFFVAPLNGRLRMKNSVDSGGTAPCHLAIDHTDQALFVANYDSGSISSFKILSDGHLSEAVSNIYFPGGSVHPERQKTAHTHSTTVSPDNRFLLVNDLGLDRIMVYRIDPKTARLAPNNPPYYAAIPGSGPRSLTFHPNGRWVYSINELDNTLDCLDWNTSKGTLTRIQNISALPLDHESTTSGATVQVHPNGHFLYASNRGDDSITAFYIHPATGRLSMMQRISCEGNCPRHFAVDPGGKWLVVANQDSANLVILKCDPATGRLSPTGKHYHLDSPVCVIFE